MSGYVRACLLSVLLAIGVVLVSYHGWWVLPGAILLGVFAAAVDK